MQCTALSPSPAPLRLTRCCEARRAWCQLCCGRGFKSLRSLFLSQRALKPLLPTVAEPLPTGIVTRAMNREAIQQV